MSDTLVLRVDPDHPSQVVVRRAASILKQGGLVAFPTETVYGLGANAMNEAAVKSIFEAKGRPVDNPLIVHVNSMEMLETVAETPSEEARRLIERFWPGPLTLVLRRRPEVPAIVSAGLDTIAVRMPENTLALELIEKAGVPVAAPSANLSGRPSPTRAEHVLHDLGGRIQAVLDGGPTRIGLESTVLDMTSDPPAILRPGWITAEAIGAVIGSLTQGPSDRTARRSPGTRHRHYMPRAPLVLVNINSAESIEDVCKRLLSEGPVAMVGYTKVDIANPAFREILLDPVPREYARELYHALRELDESNPAAIVVEAIPASGEGAAVMDRLRRAASNEIS